MAPADDGSRKRKRASERPSSDVLRRDFAVEEPGHRNIRISHIAVDGSTTIAAPVIATTGGAYLPKAATYQSYEKPLHRQRHGRNEELLLQSSDHPHIDYTIHEEDSTSTSGQLRHYLGVYDTKRNTLKVVEARSMHVQSSLRSEREERIRAQEMASQSEKPKYYEGRNELGLEFGTKKSKKAIMSLSQNAISTPNQRELSPASRKAATKQDSKASAVLQSMAGAAEAAPTREMMQAANDEAKPRPKINLDARSVEDVYDQDEIFGDQVLMALKVKPWVDAVDDDQPVHVASKFVANRLHGLATNDEIKKLKMLKYCLLLINFLSCTQRGSLGKEKKLPKKDQLMEKLREPESVVEVVKARFTNGLGIMTSWHADKLIAHLAAASLIIDGFKTDLFDLAEDTGTKMVTMRTYFKQIGATVSALTESERTRFELSRGQASMHRMARLKLPVELPVDRKRYIKKK